MPDRFVLLDTCVVINLVSTGDLASIGRILDAGFLVVDQVVAELGYLRDEVDGQIVRTPIDLQPYLSSGTVRFLSLTEEELPQYVRLATVVDDGEAATLAIAESRGLRLATDDRKARRMCLEPGLPEPIRSLHLLRSYADAAALSEQNVRQQLIRIRDRASFRPGRADPDYKWWSSHVGEEWRGKGWRDGAGG